MEEEIRLEIVVYSGDTKDIKRNKRLFFGSSTKKVAHRRRKTIKYEMRGYTFRVPAIPARGKLFSPKKESQRRRI